MSLHLNTEFFLNSYLPYSVGISVLLSTELSIPEKWGKSGLGEDEDKIGISDDLLLLVFCELFGQSRKID